METTRRCAAATREVMRGRMVQTSGGERIGRRRPNMNPARGQRPRLSCATMRPVPSYGIYVHVCCLHACVHVHVCMCMYGYAVSYGQGWGCMYGERERKGIAGQYVPCT